MNDRERDVFRYALTGGTKAVYRNYFCADEGHVDMPMLEALVERGLMEKRGRFYAGWVYRATAAGAEAAGLELP